MKKAQSIIGLLFCILLCLPAGSIHKKVLDTLAAEFEMTITSSNAQVSSFTAKNTGFTSGYEADECYNVTPAFIADNSDYAVFKYSNSTESFILYDDEVYSIGTCVGGFGITSMALADLNKDGMYELYYTFSWGSGWHRSQIGYFEPLNRKVNIFDYSLVDSDMILTVNKSGDLCVSSATLDLKDFVNFTIKAENLIGTVNYEGDRATLTITQQKQEQSKNS